MTIQTHGKQVFHFKEVDHLPKVSATWKWKGCFVKCGSWKRVREKAKDQEREGEDCVAGMWRTGR